MYSYSEYEQFNRQFSSKLAKIPNFFQIYLSGIEPLYCHKFALVESNHSIIIIGNAF
jgi:hypothetical protein